LQPVALPQALVGGEPLRAALRDHVEEVLVCCRTVSVAPSLCPTLEY
jgi:hypothetical protein